MNAPECDCGPGDLFCGHFEVSKRTAPTQPPSKADEDALAFETLIKQVGEHKVRWTHVLERAADLFGGSKCSR